MATNTAPRVSFTNSKISLIDNMLTQTLTDPLVVSDPDRDTITVALSGFQHGVLSNLGTGSLSEGGSVYTVSGTVDAVNAALAALKFTPTDGYYGSFDITTSVSDGVAPAVTGTRTILVDEPPKIDMVDVVKIGTSNVSVFKLNKLTITDADSVRLTVKVSGIDRKIMSMDGLYGLQNPDGSLTIEGTADYIVPTLGDLPFHALPGKHDSQTLTVTVTDGVASVSKDVLILIDAPPKLLPPPVSFESL